MKSSLIACVLALSACEGVQPAPYELWTFDDILAASRRGRTLAGIEGAMLAADPGQVVLPLSTPFASGQVANGSDVAGLTVLPAFIEGEPAAYMVSEIWQGFGEVWAQPEYVLVNGWAEKPGAKVGGSVFGVDVEDRFYSPWWQVIYAVVPEGTPADQYRRAEDILSDHLELHPGPAKYCSLIHDTTAFPDATGCTAFAIATPDPARPVRPLSGEPLDIPEVCPGWAGDGERVWILEELGADRFSWDQDRIVPSQPLFRFVRRGEDGVTHPIGLPNVGGTGPIGSHTPPDVRKGSPHFGALWNVVDVLVPDGAAVVVPDTLPQLRALVQSSGLPAPRLDPDVAEKNASGVFTGRVAMHPACMSDPTLFPQECGFLDSQDAIEASVAGTSFHPTDLLLAAPPIEYMGQPVPIK